MGHAAHEARGGSLLVLGDVECVEPDLDEGVALGGDAHGVSAVGACETVDRHVERGGDDVATLVVRVVARNLGATGRVDMEEALVANGAEGVFE